MATVCGGSLALFDAGVSMLHPVAGVACGLVSRKSKTVADDELEEYSILTDILVCTCVHTCSFGTTLKHTQKGHYHTSRMCSMYCQWYGEPPVIH